MKLPKYEELCILLTKNFGDFVDQKQTYAFTIDEYTTRRGPPVMLDLTCARCKAHVMFYQKDGPGPLIRCYLDRIHEPKELVNLHEAKRPFHNLKCPSCHATLGKSSIYTKENRPVFVLEENSVDSKI